MIVASLEIKMYFVEQGMIFRIWEFGAAWAGTAHPFSFCLVEGGLPQYETFTNHQ